ncbi:conserved hypothetical protein [Streptomyces sp. SPB78]|nr:conserved hypothetical protein [Streptomyces sp. SPB78]
MYARAVRTHALALVDQGRSINSVSKQTGISRSSIRGWRERGEPVRAAATCCRCQDLPTAPADPAAYSYLLGLYLGDGCLSRSAKGVHALRIACADAWPGLQDACEAALRAVLPQNSVWRTPCAGCTAVSSSSKHWACLFPQHGPGKKHDPRSASPTGNRTSSPNSPGNSCAASSIPTAAASPTGPCGR